MIVPIFMAVALCVGLFRLFGLNPSPALVLALAGLLIPQFVVQMSAARFHKESREELFTALSLVTSSYERTGNLVWAVEENVAHIHPPIDAVFAEFLRKCRVVDPSVPHALSHVRGMLANAIWREWCDTMQLCIANPAQRHILRGIVEKSGRHNRVQNELDALLPRPMQQMLLVMGMALINIPIVCFLFSDFAGILFYTVQGKCGLAVMAGRRAVCYLPGRPRGEAGGVPEGGERMMLYLLIALLFGFGLFLFVSDLLHLPSARAVHILTALDGRSTPLSEAIAAPLARPLSRILPMDAYRKRRLQKELSLAGMENTPEYYVACPIRSTISRAQFKLFSYQ